jgi:N-methylhydantoinase A/oxoprolinase/acetone carboxylase beta subunit
MIIGLDVGGTHTDVVLLSDDRLIDAIKVPTDPANLFHTVLSGLTQICQDIDTTRIERIVLSTTLTTNAIVQGKLPPVGMIVSSGPGLNPEIYRTDDHFFAVSGSMDHRGREVASIDGVAVKQVAKALTKARVRYVGVVGKFSVRNPAHEFQIKDLLGDHFERVFLGHEISGQLNFARRISTTYLNAAVYPIHREFFNAVQKSLSERGLQVPIHILKADGGTMSLEASMDFPGQAIVSGPAASVMGSVAFASENQQAMVLDIGGTTTDIALIDHKAPRLHPIGVRLGGYQTLIRSLETRSIGIGGDSRIGVKNGVLVIGPERDGPAMGFGGMVPTPTDALVVLGKMEADQPDRATAGIASIAKPLGLSLQNAAQQIFDQICRKILAEVRSLVDRINHRPVYTVQEIYAGDKVNPKTLMVLGGPAPYFAERLAGLSDYIVQVIPRWQVANAIGAALARTTCEVTLFADTELGIALAPEERYVQKITNSFSRSDAEQEAFTLLKRKALQRGSRDTDLAMEVTEQQQFNMVRGFLTTGKNIRVKVQVKPGLIGGYEHILKNMDR